jgi:hypothetical protein
VPIRGDFKALEKLIASTGRIASGELVRASIRTMGRTSFDLAVSGAEAGRNPQGRAWKKKKDGGRALSKVAGRLRLKLQNRVGFEVRSTNEVDFFHQKGAKRRGTKWRLPVRRILPKKAMPKPWREVIVERLNADWYRAFDR